EAKTPEDKAALFADKEFQNLFKEALVNKWTITPEEVMNKENVDALYQRLRSGLSRLEQSANETAGPTSPITQAVSNLNNNIDFMNQLNQMYTYIQLPLKMQNGEQHGELFVYTNKHSLASKDGSVSAFLHLDMDNLGPVDCYVTMKDSKVNTNFKLKDEETLDFIEAHMHILNDRLEKRGYSLNSKCNLLSEETSGMEEILKTDNLKVFGGHHSFDVRT
ncbi:MAG: flagellar hook-length control protein FliK, partial [Lachnospiraceae bacterium]|nr:flagellar hook-length control protein FliK [Lachnospiraceae bacterium]